MLNVMSRQINWKKNKHFYVICKPYQIRWRWFHTITTCSDHVRFYVILLFFNCSNPNMRLANIFRFALYPAICYQSNICHHPSLLPHPLNLFYSYLFSKDTFFCLDTSFNQFLPIIDLSYICYSMLEIILISFIK